MMYVKFHSSPIHTIKCPYVFDMCIPYVYPIERECSLLRCLFNRGPVRPFCQEMLKDHQMESYVPRKRRGWDGWDECSTPCHVSRNRPQEVGDVGGFHSHGGIPIAGEFTMKNPIVRNG